MTCFPFQSQTKEWSIRQKLKNQKTNNKLKSMYYILSLKCFQYVMVTYKTDRKTVGKPVKIKKNGSGRDFPIWGRDFPIIP